MKKLVPIKIKVIGLSSIIPDAWNEWFMGKFSQNAPFTWGDCTRSLVTADSFLDHCRTFINDKQLVDGHAICADDYNEFIGTVWSLENQNVLIDLSH
ncbi:MAG: hypothetical protein ABFD50_15475 [Smithella sp.]